MFLRRIALLIEGGLGIFVRRAMNFSRGFVGWEVDVLLAM